MHKNRKKTSEPARELRALRIRNRKLEAAVAEAAGKFSDLREQFDRLHALFDTAKDAILHLDAESGVILDVNRAMTELSGYTRAELLGRLFWEVGPFKEIDAGLIVFRELRDRAYIRYDDLPFKTKQNTALSAELACSVHHSGTRPLIQCTIRDVTTRKQLEEQLWKAESRFRALFTHAAVGIAVLDMQGAIVDNNRRLEEILGFGENELRGKHPACIAALENGSPDSKLYQELLAGTRDSYQVTKKCQRKDGTAVWALINTSVVRDRDARPQFAIRTVDDVSAQKDVENALQESEERFRQIAENIREVFWMTTSDYSRMLYVSPAYEEIWGRSCASLYEDSGTWIDAIVPADRTAVLSSLQGDDPYEAEYRIVRPDGALRWIRDRGFPLEDASGRIDRVVGIAQDITLRKQAEEALRESSEKIRLLLDSTGEAIYGIDTAGTCTFCNPSCLRILGYERQDDLIGKNMHALIHHSRPDGAPYPVEQCRLMRSVSEGEGGQFDEVLWRRNGTSFDAEVLSFPQKRSGNVIGAVVTFTDITERKRAEDALRRSAEEINDLYNNAPCGYHSLDENGTFVLINDTELSWLGYERQEIVGRKKVTDLFTPASVKVFELNFPAFKERGWVRDLEFEMIRKDGTVIETLLSSTVLRDSKGRFVMTRSTVYDITDRKKAERELQQANELLKVQASTDVLTGIYNRLKFTDFLEMEMRQSQRYRYPLSLIMFDVDLFKKINDTCGHLVGDEVLREIARTVSGNIRHADIFARWGGEEFMILAPHSALDQTVQLAEKLCSIIGQRSFPPVPGAVTCSFGVTEYAATDTVETFTNRVDGALYEAKKAGRNRVEIAAPPPLL